MYNIRGLKTISLLRVSTVKQATKGDKDIPTQRDLIREFVEKEELLLIREFVEGGVSGFKTSVADRDALIAIMAMAEKREFDVLLVYYSDRIGRSSEEGPFVIKYLNDRKVRVFTVREGELKTKSQVDKYFTYMAYWQNENESIKISNRSTDYRVLMVQNGKFQGGGGERLPFGYKLAKNGTKNGKGREIFDFEINPDESEVVKKIYELSINNNMGARSITNFLNSDPNYKPMSRNGIGWSFRSVQGILGNVLYKGYYHMKIKATGVEVLSPKQENLSIISEEDWSKNQVALENRKTQGKKPIKGASSGKSLLSGLVYCGHCGDKMHLWANHKRKNKNGESYIIHSYRCKNKMVRIGSNICDGQSTYSCNKIDKMVENNILDFIRDLSKNKLDSNLYVKLKNDLNIIENEKKEKEKLLVTKQKKVIVLKKETSNVMLREDFFLVEELKKSINLIKIDVNTLLKELQELDKNTIKIKSTIQDYIELDNSISTWEKRYSETDMFGKKALLNQLIEKVEISRDNIKINYKEIYKNFEKNSYETEDV